MPTYRELVAAKSPIMEFRLDGTDATAGTVNNGSNGGSATVTGTGITWGGASGASQIPGNSARFASNATGYISKGTYNNPSAYSLGFWYKRDTSYTLGLQRVIRIQVTTSNHIEVTIASNSSAGVGRIRLNDTSGLSVDFTHAPLADGNWHYVVFTAGGNIGYCYIDGVSLGSSAGSMSAKTAATLMIGGTTTSNGPAAWLDEVAVYSGQLTETEIAEQYSAATTATSTSITTQIGPASLNLSSPAPVVTAIDNNSKRISVSPMTLNLSAVGPIVYPRTESVVATAGQGVSATADAGVTYTKIGNNTLNAVYFDFPDVVIPAGENFVSAKLAFSVISKSGTDTISVSPRRITSSWTDGVYTTPTTVADNSPDTATGYASVGRKTLDVTSSVQLWLNGTDNHGMALIYRGANNANGLSADPHLNIAQHNYATAADRPALLITTSKTPGVNTVTTIPVMSLSVTTPGVTSRAVRNIRQTATASALSVSAAAPVVSTVKNPRITVPPMTINMTFPGGISRNPDFRAYVDPFEMWFFTPNANGYGGTDAKISVTPATLDLSASAPVVDLVTHKRVYVGPMNLTLNMVGMYDPAEDRYHNAIPATVDADDIWFKMEETSGTVAIDSVTNDDPERYTENGIYRGNPTFQVEGPELRKAVRFDGVDDHIVVTGPYMNTAYTDMDLTLEFSIRTTDLNGTIIRGGGHAIAPFGGNIYGGTSDSEVRLINGELALYTGSGHNIVYKTRKFIADGEWHHVIFSIPSATMFIFDAYNVSKTKPHFVMVDGQTVWTRYSTPLYGRSFLPQGIMARAHYVSGGNGNVADINNYVSSEHVAGDMRDLVVRYHYAVSQTTASKLYYEWSNSLIVNPTPITLNLSMKDPFKAKGNVKRMLAMYGLPLWLDSGFNQGIFRDGHGTYYSIMAGYHIRNDAAGGPWGPAGTWVTSDYSSNPTPMNFLPVKPFMLEGYMVYPLAIANTPGSSGVYSAPGIENGEYRDPIEKNYIDDVTGLPRFVDLDKDLREDVTAFDALTAVNYPAIRPDDGPENAGQSSDPLREPLQHNLGLTNFEWTRARDNLRDSILRAAQRGVNLWITEPQMAQHLGFIQDYDKHHTGARYEFFGPGNIDATGYTNKRAEQLDDAHLDESKPGGMHKIATLGAGQFNFTWQANAKRRIVATEPNLTNVPSWEMTERIRYKGDAAWIPHNDVTAWDLVDRTGGLQVGDHIVMDMWEQNNYTGDYPAFNGTLSGDPRKFIISAKPQGIAGKPISREQLFYYGPNGQIINNPWRDNVYTIVAERGTVVRGVAISGRAFIEFMDPETKRIHHWEDRDKSMWNGEHDKNVSTWSFDTRRYREIIIVNIVNKIYARSPSLSVNVASEERYVDIQDPELVNRPFVSMNARGLNWLKQTDTLDPGTHKTYVPTMQLTLNAANVTISKTRNLVNTVNGPMRIDLDMRRVRNFEHGEVREKVLPMVLNLEQRGFGKRIQVPSVELQLETPNVTVTGDGDAIFVYMDAEREVTLFIKED